MLKRILLLGTVLLGSFNLIGKDKIPLPTQPQLRWHESELGVVYHYDLHVFDSEQYSQGHNRINPIYDHNIFNPTELDTDQWVKAAKEAGAKFAVITATHETGFALYQSEVNPYCLKTVNWREGKGDIVRDFVNSCRKYDILPGIYIGIRWNSLLGIHNFKSLGDNQFAKNRQAWYKNMCEGMVRELCSNYGDLFMIWFDGGADDPLGDGPDVLPIVSELQPDCLFYHNVQRADFRWGGSETGTVSYPCWSTFPNPFSHHNRTETDDHNKLLRHGDKNGKYWVPAMADTPLRGTNGRHEWFWEPGDEHSIFPLDDLMNIYYKSIGRNSTLIVGLTPDDKGVMPQADVERLKEWGTEIRRRFDKPVATTQGNTKQLILNLKANTPINHIVIQENLKYGELIREYKVEAFVDKKWIEVCSGESVGHKRIQEFNTVITSRLRLTVQKALNTPVIREFAAYHVD